MSRDSEARRVARKTVEAAELGLTLRELYALEEANKVLADDMRSHPADYSYSDLVAMFGAEGAARVIEGRARRRQRRSKSRMVAIALSVVLVSAGLAAVGLFGLRETDMLGASQAPTAIARPTRTPIPTRTPDVPRLTKAQVVAMMLGAPTQNGGHASCAIQDLTYEGRGIWNCGLFMYDELNNKAFLNLQRP